LLLWYDRAHRDLPWRRTTDPYRIWISEIMLQQTRAQAVIPYYQKFLERFPDVEALAAASETEVLALWSGLGYYSRARNLRRAAQQIADRGEFPRDHASLVELPGIGDYTAAAIASIAFGLPHAVLDGNVMRVIARLRNDSGELSSPCTRLRLKTTAQELLDPADPGRFNQALMELGATVCLPKAPQCHACPLTALCEGQRLGTASQLPVKLRKQQPVRIAGELMIIHRRNRILLWQRAADSGRMAGFWELPETWQVPGARTEKSLGEFRHTITHHHFTFQVVLGSLVRSPKNFHWIGWSELGKLPVSTITRKALRLCPEFAKVL
jgi:A/G-specific adenine glycosylase